jgi:hypothetical protein
MTTADNTLNKYLSLMTEIRKREEVIIGMHSGICNAKYKIVNYEVMFFQLRKILEIIVKSPMLINENEYRSVSKKPEDDWRIKDIIDNLKKINPDFYPAPIEIVKQNGQPDKFVPKASGFLTIAELCEAYNHCNGFLHAQNPLRQGNTCDFDEEWAYISSIIDKIHKLLNPHLCRPTASGQFYYIGMENGQGFPHGNLFGKV